MVQRGARWTRSTVAVIGGAVAAAALVTAGVVHGVAAASVDPAADQHITGWSPAEGPSVGMVVETLGVPATPCAGSYLSTQQAGAAAPLTRAGATGP